MVYSINGCIQGILNFTNMDCLLIFMLFLFDFSKIEYICGANLAKKTAIHSNK